MMNVKLNEVMEFDAQKVLDLIDASRINGEGLLYYIYEIEDGKELDGYSADMWVEIMERYVSGCKLEPYAGMVLSKVHGDVYQLGLIC